MWRSTLSLQVSYCKTIINRYHKTMRVQATSQWDAGKTAIRHAGYSCQMQLRRHNRSHGYQTWQDWKWCGRIPQWGRVTHICVGKLTIIGSDNGLSPGRRQAIIRTNAGILFIGTLGTNFSEILSEIPTFSFKKMYLKMSSGRWRPFCLGLNVIPVHTQTYICVQWLCIFPQTDEGGLLSN